MNPKQMLASLIEQRKKIDMAIAGVQPLINGKRGRPSKDMMAAKEIMKKKK
jgi:hypothetical protein